MTKVVVLGAGSFGTALAVLLARIGHRVRLWDHNPNRAKNMAAKRCNSQYLEGVDFPEGLEATAELGFAIDDADFGILAVPSHAADAMAGRLGADWQGRPLVIAAKGLDPVDLRLMSEVVTAASAGIDPHQLWALSGPSFAKEIAMGHPTAVVLAGPASAVRSELADAFFCDAFRVYTCTDLIGVQLGGALKNVMAIAAGAVLGMGLGHNTHAALLTRGLAEITRIAVAQGAQAETLSGLAGLGDLALTCGGGLSRNRKIGVALGEGKSLAQAMAQTKQVVEGVQTARSAHRLAASLGVDAPIIDAVYQVVHEGMSARDAITRLVRRHPGDEFGNESKRIQHGSQAGSQS